MHSAFSSMDFLSGRPVFALGYAVEGFVRTRTALLREVFSAHRAYGFSPALVGRGKDLFGEI